MTHGAATHLSHQTEYVLIGAAVLIAIAGIVFAVVRLRPSKLVPARDAVPEQGIARVLADKWYVDEAYDKVVVRPTMDASRKVLWRGVDVGLIDGLFVNGSAFLARSVGWVGSQIQTGRVGTYAWVLVLGAVGVLSVFSFR